MAKKGQWLKRFHTSKVGAQTFSLDEMGAGFSQKPLV